MKKRLDQVLVDQKQVQDLPTAKSYIMRGLVLIKGQVQNKPGTMIAPDTELTVKEPMPYVSRGGIKLKGAIDHFKIALDDQIILDVGASTGGFTDCLLQEGAKHVYCIDVGKNQLHEKLKDHKQVTAKEGFHVENLSPQTFDRSFDWIVMDVSFISIITVIPYVLNVLNPAGQMLILFKPQFEAPKKSLVKGVVQDPELRKALLRQTIDTLTQNFSLQILGHIDSTIQGPKGNQETLLWLQRSP